MNDLDQHLAFILGHYKSGSTWLANLLSLHPDVMGLRETHVFRYSQDCDDFSECTDRLCEEVAWAGGGKKELARHKVGNLLRPVRRSGQATLKPSDRPMTLLDLSIADQRNLRKSLKESSSWQDYCRTFYGFHYEVLKPSQYLVDKTSTNITYAPDAREVFPAAKLIAVYRDGRDVVVSDRFHLKNRYGKEQDFEASVRTWKRAVDTQLEHEHTQEIHTLSYESLLSDGPATATRLLEHLDVDRSEERVSDLLHRSSFKFVSGRQEGAEDAGSFYRKGVAGDWQNHLSDDELRVFSELAGEALVRLGYETSPDWKDWT